MMPEQQTFFYVSDDPEPVCSNSPLWNTDMPRGRHPSSSLENSRAETLTYGGYYSAVSDFLKTQQTGIILKAASHIAGRAIHPHEISNIHIHLEKHGAFYHPARIVLPLLDAPISLVVNLAVSVLGKQTIGKEYHLLKRLAGRYSPAWVPEVFGEGRVRVGEQQQVRMFLGEWFKDFHEFHVSGGNDSVSTGVRVWDPMNGNLFLSQRQIQGVFEQAAMILTAYYNIETFEQIDSWHHAAGDFVVSLHENELRLKLVTVRGYKPLFSLTEEITPETILNTLLIFFLRLSIHLRIDRRDGVGDVTWISMDVVGSIYSGFFKGLELQSEKGFIPPALIDAFRRFLLHLPGEDIQDVCVGIVSQFDSGHPDLPVIRQNLDTHVEGLLSGRCQMKTML